MRISKLFKKSLIVMVILFGLIATTISMLSGWLLQQHLTDEYRSKAMAIARSIASSSPETFIHLDSAKVQSIIDQYTEIQGVSYVTVSSPFGEIIAHTFVPQVPMDVLQAHKKAQMAFKTGSDPLVPSIYVQEVGNILDVSLPIIAGVAGYVHVGMDLGIIRTAIWKAIARIQLMTLGIFLIGVGLAYVTMNSVSRPLAQLTEYAEKVAAHDFPADLDIRSKDEIGQLASSMNSMAHEIRNHLAEMQKAIDFATAELQDTLGQLQESEEWYRTTFEHTGTAMILIEADTTVSLMNSQFEQLSGFSRDEVEGQLSWLSFVDPEDLNRVIGLRTRRRKKGRAPNQYEFTFINRKGEHRNIFISVELIPGTRKTIASLIDITERIQAEEALKEAHDLLETRVKERTARLEEANRALQLEIAERRQAEAELQRSQRTLSVIIDSMPIGVLVIGRDKAIRQANKPALRMMGYEFETEVIGKICHETLCPSEIGRCPVMDLGQAMDLSERVLLGRNGVQIPILKSVVTVTHEAEEVLIEAFIDLTENKEAEEEKARLQSHLRHAQKMEAIGTLASGIAHDFNNILQAISGYVQVVRERGGGSEDNAWYLGEVDQAVDRASDLVQHLLTFSRRVEPKLKPLSLNRVVERMVGMLERTIPKMITIRTRFEEKLALVEADQNQVERLLMNLATNARDAMPEGGELSFETRNVVLNETYCRTHTEVAPGEYAALIVSDNGAGMDPDTTDRIYEPFFTTKEVGEGTGLGMATVYGIVKGHGGHITCRSEPGRGTRFHMYFPPSKLIVRDEVVPASPVEGDAFRGDETILIVDDETAILETVSDIFEDRGYRVVTARSGEAALDIYMADHADIDLIILDLGMPGMGGMNCLRALLKINPEAKVIIASGYASDERARKAMKEGARAFVHKPYRLTDMASQVRRILEGRSG